MSVMDVCCQNTWICIYKNAKMQKNLLANFLEGKKIVMMWAVVFTRHECMCIPSAVVLTKRVYVCVY